MVQDGCGSSASKCIFSGGLAGGVREDKKVYGATHAPHYGVLLKVLQLVPCIKPSPKASPGWKPVLEYVVFSLPLEIKKKKKGDTILVDSQQYLP